jgi:hypothetical protein
LLTATRIVSISNDILTFAISTSVNNKFGDHPLTLLHITSTYPLPSNTPAAIQRCAC